MIGFLDDDVIPSPSWLDVHLQCHLNSNEPLVSIGSMSLPIDKRLPPWNEWEVLSLGRRYKALESGSLRAEPSDLYTANAMIPRNALEQVGGFDATLRRAEDIELGLRLAKAGLKFEFLSDANVAHYPIRTLESWKKIPIAYAKSHFEMQNGQYGEDIEKIGSPQLGNMHPATRIAVRAFGKNKIISGVYCFIAQGIGSLAHFARLSRISYAAFSSVYNVLYFYSLEQLQVQRQNLLETEKG